MEDHQLFVGERDLLVQARCCFDKNSELETFQFYLVKLTDRTICLTTDREWSSDGIVRLKLQVGSEGEDARAVTFQAKVRRKVGLLGGLHNYHLEMLGVTSDKRAEIESLLGPFESLSGRIYYHHYVLAEEDCVLHLPAAQARLHSLSCGELSFIMQDPLQTGELLDGNLNLENSEFPCRIKVEEVNQSVNSGYLCWCSIRSFSKGEGVDLRKLLEKKARKVSVLVA